MEKQETVGENKDGNLVIRGECVSACAYLKEQGTQVDLVYIAPPFASGADYAKKVYLRCHPKVAEAIAPSLADTDVELRTTMVQRYKDIDAGSTDPVMERESFEPVSYTHLDVYKRQTAK